jgi:8-oxo-dGTP diphosphatase
MVTTDLTTYMVNYLLFFISIILLILVVPLAYLYTLVFHYRKMRKLKFEMALSIDQFGNCACQYLFNDLLIKEGGYRFGNIDETISSVLGKNKRDNTLTWLGQLLSNILDAIDENHVLKSIDETI